jgi:hypothetical protein
VGVEYWRTSSIFLFEYDVGSLYNSKKLSDIVILHNTYYFRTKVMYLGRHPRFIEGFVIRQDIEGKMQIKMFEFSPKI